MKTPLPNFCPRFTSTRFCPFQKKKLKPSRRRPLEISMRVFSPTERVNLYWYPICTKVYMDSSNVYLVGFSKKWELLDYEVQVGKAHVYYIVLALCYLTVNWISSRRNDTFEIISGGSGCGARGDGAHCHHRARRCFCVYVQFRWWCWSPPQGRVRSPAGEVSLACFLKFTTRETRTSTQVLSHPSWSTGWYVLPVHCVGIFHAPLIPGPFRWRCN